MSILKFPKFIISQTLSEAAQLPGHNTPPYAKMTSQSLPQTLDQVLGGTLRGCSLILPSHMT